jgi:hypothetical protein
LSKQHRLAASAEESVTQTTSVAANIFIETAVASLDQVSENGLRYEYSKPFQRYAFDINRIQLYKAALMCAQVINLAFGDNLRASRSENASQ